MSRKVLLVTNRRPDDPGGRAEKVATRVRLLRERGWEVVVGHVPEPYVTGFPVRFYSLLRTARSADVDAVLSINNPFHLHFHGFLASSLLRVPWIAEFRDPILPRPDLSRGSVKWYPAAAVEWLVAHRADRVLWFDGIQLPDDYFETTYPDVDPDTFVKLPPMGYEQEKFEGADPVDYDRFTITYAGSFYEGWIEPYDFLEGLGAYLDGGGDDDANSDDGNGDDAIDGDRDDEIRAQFYGDWSREYERAVEGVGVSDVVETHEFVPHEEIVPVLKGSDAVLYIGGSDPSNARNIPSKMFDYVGARTPILAVVDPGFRVAEFVRDNELGLVVPPGDPEALSDALAAMVDGSYEYDPDPAIFDRYTRSETAGRIADALDAVAADSTSS